MNINRILRKTKEDYNMIASHFSEKRRFVWGDLKPFLKLVKSGDKVLDAGCGNGRLYKELKNKKIKYLGIDFSQELLKIAQKQNPQAKFKYGDLTEKKTWESLENFDLCFCLAVLHHFPTQEGQLRVLRNIYKGLKKNGLLVITVWNLWQKRFWKLHFKQLVWKIIKGFKLKWLMVPYKVTEKGKVVKVVDRFCYAFALGELRSLMESVGFKIDDELGQFKNDGRPSNIDLTKRNLCLVARK